MEKVHLANNGYLDLKKNLDQQKALYYQQLSEKNCLGILLEWSIGWLMVFFQRVRPGWSGTFPCWETSRRLRRRLISTPGQTRRWNWSWGTGGRVNKIPLCCWRACCCQAQGLVQHTMANEKMLIKWS